MIWRLSRLALPTTLVLSCVASCSSNGNAPTDQGPRPDSRFDSLRLDAGPSDPLIATGLDVKTQLGALRGTTTSGGARAWLGIPYAAPPVGANRFRAPQPPPTWAGSRDATALGAQCPQASGGDEDCLFLNVWAPDPSPKQALPVMVFFHGGAFIGGSGGDALYEGSTLARLNVILVTVNYRLGPLGFLGHPVLAQEEPQSGTGNYGLLDQRAALSWVKQNIHPFGGDATNVTIFGESAGAYSVGVHLVSPGSKGLFQRAIIQSGAPCVGLQLTVAEAGQQAEALAKAFGCMGPVIDCLRAQPAKEFAGKLVNPSAALPGGIFQGVTSQAQWGPVADKSFTPGQVTAAYATGAITIVSTILGTTGIEGKLFHLGLGGDHTVSDAVAYEAALQRMFGADTPKVLARYPGTSFKSFDAALAQIDTDAIFVCPERRMARALVKAGAPTYRYHFARACDRGLGALGAMHATELAFVFGNDSQLGCGVSSAGEPLRMETMAYWTRFARSGDPNGGSSPTWPKYDGASDPYLVMDIPLGSAKGLMTDACDFWDGISYSYPKTY